MGLAFLIMTRNFDQTGRPLTVEERTLCEWLIAHGTSKATEYAPQLSRVTVVGTSCRCGCPSVDLAVDGKHTVGPSEIIGDAVGSSPEGVQVGVILHCREGQLSELEVYPFSDVQARFGLPKPEALTSIVESSSQ
jgi:hypothetical protein